MALVTALRRFFDSPKGQAARRRIHWRTLIKGTAIIMLAPVMLIAIYLLYNVVGVSEAAWGLGVIFILSLIFVRPYIADLGSLTRYVEQLAEDKKAEPPDLSFLSNVEELSQAVERLHRSWEARREQLESLVGESKIVIDTLPDVLIFLDHKGNIVRTNNAAVQNFGQPYEEAFTELLAHPTLQQAIRAVLEEKEGHGVEFSLEDPLYRDYLVRVERFPVSSPTGIAVIIAMHDVTELKRTEQTFADFVANASHEIRTPLTSLIGFIETLRTTAKEDAAARETFLETMEQQAERMSNLVDDLLSLSKIERGNRTPPSETIDVHDILAISRKNVAHAAEAKQIQVGEVYDAALPAVLGDANELILVFTNLINNAIKYSPAKSKITIKTERLKNKFPERRRFKGQEMLLAVSVVDEGEGIPQEHIPRLTERFYRVDTARSRKEGGTGLGLSIVKHVLDRHGGWLHVESNLGHGSTFTVLLPLG